MILLGDHKLSIADVVRVAREREEVQLSDQAKQLIERSQMRLQNIVKSGKPVYGINTGFGIFADRRIKAEESNQLSRNLILSHSVGTGDPLSTEVVRAAMLVRANTLAQGFSGVRVEIVQTLLDMLNKGVHPVIPSQGSLGSSGDLCQLSHLALVFTTDTNDLDEESGRAEFKGSIQSGKATMKAAGIQRLILGAKEGLAINNGATFSAAVGALAVADAEYLLSLSTRATALSLEAMLGCSDAFDERIHLARGQYGQIEMAAAIRGLFAGSTLVDSTARVQDAYSLRCSPQILGAAKDTLDHVKGVIEREINAATDNPLIFDDDAVLSGGNFHGEPVGMAMDFLSIAMAEVGAISERRTFRLTDGKLNQGLTPMLVDTPEDAGLNSGVMMPQYTAASLVLENQTLATPDSVHSLPTSAEQEDHNANAMTAARHCAQILANTRHILSVELFTAARAIDIRLRLQPGKLGSGTEKLYRAIRRVSPYKAGDSLWGLDIEKIKREVTQQSL
jgi:histidine ammonia-lyase